ENRGGSPATPTLTDKVPANTTYTGEASEGWGPSCVALPVASPAGTPCTQVVAVPPATATEAGQATGHLTVTVDKPLPPLATVISNVVTSSEGPCQAAEPQCTVANPTVAQPTTTKTLASVNGEPASAGETVRPGDKLTYEITVTNHGGSPATP